MLIYTVVVRRVRTFALAAVVAVVPLAVHAEEPPAPRNRRIEIGVGLVGLSVQSSGGDTTTSVGSPASLGSALAAGSQASAAFFVLPKVAIEPQVSFAYASTGDFSMHVLSVAAQADYVFRGSNRRSPVAFGRGVLHSTGIEDATSTRYGVGGGLGYRLPLGDSGVVRLEARFDHVFAKEDLPSINVYSTAIVIGIRP